MAFSECPKCAGRIRVVDSRDNGDEVRRRYKCAACSSLFYSAERMVAAPAVTITRDARGRVIRRSGGPPS
jgi:transcriptional regulator NrdR family protein